MNLPCSAAEPLISGAFPPAAPAGTGPSAAIPRRRRLRDFRCCPWPGARLGLRAGLAAGLVLLAASAFAADGVFAKPVTPATRPAMLAACEKVAANPVVSGVFTQTKRVTRLKKDFVSTGRFIFSGEQGVWWSIEKPFPSTIIMTADKLVQRGSDGKTSVLDASGNAVFKRFADTIQSVFAGRLVAMEKDFDLYYQPEGSGWRLGLVPREASVRKVIKSMEIEGGEVIKAFRLVEATGDTVDYRFDQARVSGQLTDDEKRLFLF